MKKKMIREYLKTSFGAVFFTVVLGALLCYLVLFYDQSPDVSMPQYLIWDIQNDLNFDETGVAITQHGLKMLQKQHCWLQVIDAQGNVLGNINADKKLPQHYSLYELVDYSLTSGRLDHDTLFVKKISKYPEYSMILGCDSRYVQKYSILLFGSHILLKVCLILLVVTLVVVYISSSIFSRKITIPIMKIMEDIPRIAKGSAIEQLDRSSIFAGVSRQLEDLQYRLQENKRMRTEWIANLSHDMKTPLSTIRGYAEVLAEEEYQFEPEEVREFAREIAKSEQYMENLIQDLRLSQKLVEGKIPLQAEEVDLLSLLQNSMDHIEPIHNQQDSITVNCDDNIRLCCDPKLMERCLVNIISNAFIHNSEGVRVAIIGKLSHNVVYLEIQDDGRGMDEEESRHIFERYYHGTNSQQRGGTGLGLAIAKETVEAHGGNIAVDSQKGRGTTFYIQLPTGISC
ncbi:MAG: HAMP domain-containing histidine kinase [Lachnospiraceae bacterium]|nr:HAMP domain-containing histidine kinase [Lachnospiraceae bacterium]